MGRRGSLAAIAEGSLGKRGVELGEQRIELGGASVELAGIRRVDGQVDQCPRPERRGWSTDATDDGPAAWVGRRVPSTRGDKPSSRSERIRASPNLHRESLPSASNSSIVRRSATSPLTTTCSVCSNLSALNSSRACPWPYRLRLIDLATEIEPVLRLLLAERGDLDTRQWRMAGRIHRMRDHLAGFRIRVADVT